MAEMFEAFTRADQHRCGQVYVRGLLLEGRRTSVEPMATRLGPDGNRQALAHFVTTSPWNHPRALLKDGDASACVSRQYTDTAGKVTNCQAGVSVQLARDHASAPVNWRLFLPKSWDAASELADPVKAARCERRGIPVGPGHVEKRQLALDMIDETLRGAWTSRWSWPVPGTATAPRSGWG